MVARLLVISQGSGPAENSAEQVSRNPGLLRYNGKAATSMADERLQLTVHLERSGDLLQVSYYDAKAQRIGETASVPWASIGPDFVYTSGGVTRTGLDAINAALEQGDANELVSYFTQSRLVDVGHIFFYTLFGNSERWEPVLRKLFDEYGDPRPNPPRKSVRVRISTTVNELIDMPWRLAAWKGKFLANDGWTFEVAADVRTGRDVELDTPCPILVIAPTFAGMKDIGTNEHVAGLRQALPAPYLTSSYFRVAATVDEARTAFSGMRPRLVYYYGHADIRGGQLCLLFGDATGQEHAISALDFKRLMGEQYPHLAYINACKSGASGWHSVGYQLAPEVPVVIANATTAWSVHASRSALSWLTRCLVSGHDPVLVAHEVDEHVSVRGFEWGMRTIHAHYGSWRAQPLATLGPITPVGLRLDRDSSRERAFSRVVSLVRSDEQRAMALISYAKVGNRIDLSSRQLKDFLEEHASHVAHMSWRDVSFPTERPITHKALERELTMSLGAAPSEPVEHVLRRCARGLGLGSATPVVWLDFGVFGSRFHRSLGQRDLETWVQYVCYLAQCTPADMRVIGYIALETATAPHTQLESLVDSLTLDYITNEAFSVDLIPPLMDVNLVDIATFLQDRNNTRCPPNLVTQMAKLLFDTAKGNYEKTLALIERAENESWHSLLNELNPHTTTEPLAIIE